MRISDVIAAYINGLLETAGGGEAQLQRNELAEELGCVPSQINYVITSRFTPEQGYIVESRRGGGGYIRIRRVQGGRRAATLMHIVNSLGEALSPSTARAVLDNMASLELLSPEAVRVMAAALSDQAYRAVPPACRDALRAEQMKAMLAALIT